MGVNGSGKRGRTERWDAMYDALSAQPRRMIIFSLLNEPEIRWLPLPDAAHSAMHPMDSENARIRLRHHHLPKLAASRYIRWERDPFRVQRGPRFEEPAFVIRKVTDSGTDCPDRLREECVVIGGPKE